MITRFVDASTADGYNPYRVTREGFEWEVKDPHDAWSHIGYWGDHQVDLPAPPAGALLPAPPRPAERRCSTGAVFTYAAVPYRIKPHAALVADPQDTIEFDERAHRTTLARAATLGADGKLVLDAGLEPYRVTLLEKLLVMVLAKLANYVPEAGLWLSTQRPEWNDANNALVGHGASMVTLYHLRRFLHFFRDLLATRRRPTASSSRSRWRTPSCAWPRCSAASRDTSPAPSPTASGGRCSTSWPAPGATTAPGSTPRASPRPAPPWRGRRCGAFLRLGPAAPGPQHPRQPAEDGLYHAYNLIKIGAGGIRIRRLPEMLEGQVAALSSGALSRAAALSLLDALRASRLYRPDQAELSALSRPPAPPFPGEQPPAAGRRRRLRPAERPGRRGGHPHREPGRRRRRALPRRFPQRPGPRPRARRPGRLPPRATLAAAERAALLELYERVFDHQSFTGRSGSFFKYEGLGCIYWHMVSKLLLAVQEVLDGEAGARAGRRRGRPAGAPPARALPRRPRGTEGPQATGRPRRVPHRSLLPHARPRRAPSSRG